MKVKEYLTENKDSIKDLQKSIDHLKKFISNLENESEKYYKDGDNFRGNIRHDAATRLKTDLKQLSIGYDYISKALKK
jgi:DNA repair ATPase RecN